MSWTIKQGDREPAFTSQLLVGDLPIDLTGRTVKFLMRNAKTGVLKVNASATVDDAANGRVSYAWAAGDTDTPDLYRAEWEITTSGLKRTVPSAGYLYIVVMAEVG